MHFGLPAVIGGRIREHCTGDQLDATLGLYAGSLPTFQLEEFGIIEPNTV